MESLKWHCRRHHAFGVAILLLLTLVAALSAGPAAAASTLHVTNCADSGAGTLRAQIAAASAGDTIIWDQDCTTTLTSGSLTLDKNLTIDGSGHQVIVDGNNATTVLVVNESAVVSIDGLTIQHGNGAGSAGDGGGISNQGTLTLTDVTLQENTTSGYGGGIRNDGTLTVQRSAFLNNNVASAGGGIVNGGTATVVNSTFSGNVALSPGGAIENVRTLTVANSTFANNNSSYDYGGGIANESEAMTTLNNVIIANSTGGNLEATPGSVFSGDNNLIDDDTISLLSGSNNRNQPVLLGPLGDYGGPTQTVPLFPGSPAIDAGDDTICVAIGTGAVNSVDQRGTARPQGDHCDIGAVESRGFSLSVTSGDHQSAEINTAFAEPLVATFGETGGHGYPGISVNFTANTGGNGQSAALSGSPVTTDNNGQASVTATANGVSGSYTVTASATGATSVNFTLTNLSPDSTPPATTADSSSYTFGTWTDQPVTVTLSATDSTAAIDDVESGVANTFYTLDSGSQQTYADPFTVSTDGDHIITFWSVDNDNNTEAPQTVHVMIDRTPPTIVYTGNQGSYTIDQTVNIHCQASDALSGIVTTTCADITGSAASFGLGAHTVSAGATDAVGNSGSGSVTFTVEVTPNSLVNLTSQYAGNSRLASRLTAPLQLVQLAERMHNQRMKDAAIDSYIFLLHTTYARGLTPEEIATLTRLALAL